MIFKKKLAFVLLFTFLVITFMIAYFREPIYDSESRHSFYSSFNKSEETIYPEIYINGDFELAAAASSGNGTAEHPYIIENETIDLISGICFLIFDPGPRIGILIRNTTKYFIIRHCDINIARSCSNYIEFYGVWLDNVTNGSLINTSIKNTDSVIASMTGIFFSNCSNVNLSNNVISNQMIGINLCYSNYNQLTKNIVNSNICGLSFGNSSNNTISNNEIYSNSIGLGLCCSSNYNSISNNKIYSNSNGLSLCCSSNYNSITQNFFYNNREGIYEEASCVGNNFENNIIINRVDIPPVEWLIPTFIGLGLITTIIYLRKKSRRSE